MTTFDDREKAFEAMFAHNEEMAFRVTARRNKLLGLWLADAFGLTGDEAQAYAMSVVRSDMEQPGEEDVVRKVLDDIASHKVAISESDVRLRLRELMHTAYDQIKAS